MKVVLFSQSRIIKDGQYVREVKKSNYREEGCDKLRIKEWRMNIKTNIRTVVEVGVSPLIWIAENPRLRKSKLEICLTILDVNDQSSLTK